MRQSKYAALVTSIQKDFDAGKPLVHVIANYSGLTKAARKAGKAWRFANGGGRDYWIIRPCRKVLK